MDTMCNATLAFCRSCFQSGGVFVKLQAGRYCCPPNLATLEGYIQHPFDNENECPPEEEEASMALAFAAGSGFACATIGALGYCLYRKFIGSKRGHVTIPQRDNAVEMERMTSTGRGAVNSDVTHSDGSIDTVLTDTNSTVVQERPAARMELVPVQIHGRPMSSARSTGSTQTVRAGRSPWETLDGFDPDEDNDFNMLRAWRDGCSVRPFTRRTTRQKETEIHEVTLL